MNEKQFFELISRFLDHELEKDIFDEFEGMLEDPFFSDFFNTFCRSIELCHEMRQETVPEELHVTLIEVIQHTPQKPALKKRKN